MKCIHGLPDYRRCDGCRSLWSRSMPSKPPRNCGHAAAYGRIRSPENCVYCIAHCFGMPAEDMLRWVAAAYDRGVLYHSTPSENVNSIMRSGLDPRRGGETTRQRYGYPSDGHSSVSNSLGVTHLTYSRSLACQYQHQFRNLTGSGSQLQVFLPNSLVPGRDFWPDPHFRTAIQVPQRIPPDRIRVRGQAGTGAFVLNKISAIRSALPDRLASYLSDREIRALLRRGYETGYHSDSDTGDP